MRQLVLRIQGQAEQEGPDSDLVLLFKLVVQKAERERTAQDVFDEANESLGTAKQGGAGPARLATLQRRVDDAAADRQVARTIADISRKIAKDVLYPEGPKMVRQTVQSDQQAVA